MNAQMRSRCMCMCVCVCTCLSVYVSILSDYLSIYLSISVINQPVHLLYRCTYNRISYIVIYSRNRRVSILLPIDFPFNWPHLSCLLAGIQFAFQSVPFSFHVQTLVMFYLAFFFVLSRPLPSPIPFPTLVFPVMTFHIVVSSFTLLYRDRAQNCSSCCRRLSQMFPTQR